MVRSKDYLKSPVLRTFFFFKDKGVILDVFAYQSKHG